MSNTTWDVCFNIAKVFGVDPMDIKINVQRGIKYRPHRDPPSGTADHMRWFLKNLNPAQATFKETHCKSREDDEEEDLGTWRMFQRK